MRGFANSDELYPFYVQIRLEKTSPTETYKLWDVPFFPFQCCAVRFVHSYQYFCLARVCSKSVKHLQCLQAQLVTKFCEAQPSSKSYIHFKVFSDSF